MLPPAAFRSPIFSDKFFPPQIDSSHFLLRERIIGLLQGGNGARRSCIVVEGQPGQGKTTAIKQYLDRIGVAAVWYRVGPEDADPGFFLQALSACLATVLVDYPSAATARILAGGDLTPLDLPRQMDMLLRDLHQCLRGELHLVFDDLQHLLSHPSSLFILSTLLESAPGTLHTILISREQLAGLARLEREPLPLRLDHRILAMNEDEVADFFHHIVGIDVPLDQTREVIRLTDGWAMGIRLLGLHLEQGHGTIVPPAGLNRQTDGCRQLFTCFGQEIFTLLDEAIHRPLLLLALLDEIPVALAIELTGMSDIGSMLGDMAKRNIFLHSLDPKGATYGYHHLFQQFLRDKARQTLSRETLVDAYRRAAAYHLARGNPAQALHFLLLAEDFQQLEDVLRQTGMPLLATNRAATLAALLGRIPETMLHQLGWSSFFLALALMDSTPTSALPLLDRALTLFSDQGDEVGELLSLTHCISVCITTTGHYRDGEPFLLRAVELFSRVADALDTATTILVARSLAMGYCIFLAEVDEANRFGSLALTLARREQLTNLEAALLMVMGYIRIFAGHTSLVRMYLEQAAPLVHHPEVGTFNRLSIRMMLFNFLFHDGDFSNYLLQKNQLIELLGIELVTQSIAGPFCSIWEMDIALSKGDAVAALDIAAQALARNALSPHVVSQILHLKGMALALEGHHDRALAAACESVELRNSAGGLYFITLNKVLTGVTHTLCGNHEKGLRLLDEGIEDARRMPTEYLEACGLLHRADTLWTTGRHQAALKDIEAGMRLLCRNGYRHLWAWTPASTARMLSLAVRHRFEPACARTLAADRLNLSILDDGTAIPLLDLRTLGDLSIMCQGTTLLESEALTPLQRELLALLLATPGLKLPQESICLHFWPDSSQATVKIKFDTLVSRLRKTLAEVLPGNTAHLYLNREKGMLWLAHCRIDAHSFLNGVKRGMVHYRLQEFWQAGNAFATAEPLWQGEFVPGVAGDDRIRLFRDSLVASLADMAEAWSDLLVRSDRFAAAIQVIDKALLFDPLNDHLYTLLYRLEGRRSAMHARRVVQRYERILRQEGYHEREIAEQTRSLAAAPGFLSSAPIPISRRS